jgi:SAM-dependent methyltransferase
MRWLAKALLQKTLSALPQAERANYLLQRHVTRSLPGPEAGFRRRFQRAARHVEAYAAHGPERPLGEAVFYEFGAGWDLAVPLSFWTLGVEGQVLVDLRPNVRLDLVNTSIERLGRLATERGLRSPGGPITSLEELEPRFGIRYLAPVAAQATGLPTGSVDFVTSTSTLEHIPEDDLVPLLAECRRLLRPDGAVSSRIDLSDHFSHFDHSLSPYNFLRYSDRRWPWSTRSSCTRTASAGRTTSPPSSGRALPLSPRRRGGRTSLCRQTSTRAFETTTRRTWPCSGSGSSRCPHQTLS